MTAVSLQSERTRASSAVRAASGVRTVASLCVSIPLILPIGARPSDVTKCSHFLLSLCFSPHSLSHTRSTCAHIFSKYLSAFTYETKLHTRSSYRALYPAPALSTTQRQTDTIRRRGLSSRAQPRGAYSRATPPQQRPHLGSSGGGSGGEGPGGRFSAQPARLPVAVCLERARGSAGAGRAAPGLAGEASLSALRRSGSPLEPSSFPLHRSSLS